MLENEKISLGSCVDSEFIDSFIAEYNCVSFSSLLLLFLFCCGVCVCVYVCLGMCLFMCVWVCLSVRVYVCACVTVTNKLQ